MSSTISPVLYTLIRDGLSGAAAAVVIKANIVSFGALMFPGELAAGVPIAIWSMLVGTCIGGIIIASTTSLQPLASGMDSPAGAVFLLISATVAAHIHAAGPGADVAVTVTVVMTLFTATSVIIALLLLALGALRWGAYFQFVPSCVVAGFLGATGWFLIAGAIRLSVGRTVSFAGLTDAWDMIEIAKLASSGAVLLVLLAIRRWVGWVLALPVGLIAMSVAGILTLQLLNLSGREHGWFLRTSGALAPWNPLNSAAPATLISPLLSEVGPEMIAAAIVALVSLVTKVSAVELMRRTSGDLDRECLIHGASALVSAPVGGIFCSAQPSISRLLQVSGGATRASGCFAALAVGLVALSNADLPGLIPIPIIAGLVLYLGVSNLTEAFGRPLSQRAWFDVLLGLGIAAFCVTYGYLVGVVAGLILACQLFVISYARVGVIHRHLSRAQFQSQVHRTAEQTQFLRENGDAIQLYWLAGYIFFGSSEAAFREIRRRIAALPTREGIHIVLDFSMVAGTDTSSIVSLAKLRNYCDREGVTIVYSGLSERGRKALEEGGLVNPARGKHAFADLNTALTWCEDRILSRRGHDAAGEGGFMMWLRTQMGGGIDPDDLIAYFERRDIPAAQVIYRQGEAADTLDLVARGSLAVDIEKGNGECVTVGRIMTHTVVGEMGFFRQATRSAIVASDGPATLYTLTRPSFERMRRERPDLASAFDDFIIRTLADRIDFADREIAALSR